MPSKGSKDKGSKDSKGAKGSKGSPDRLSAIEQEIFGRKRYDDMDSIFIRKSTNIVLFAPKIHLYEIWNQLPPLQQPREERPSRGTSPKSKDKSPANKKGSKSPKSKSPGKNSGGSAADEEDANKPEYERAILIGAVAVPSTLLKPDDKIFVEVTANFAYYAYSKVPPFPESVVSKVRCYRDFYYIFPYNFERATPFMVFTQDMLVKVHDEYPKGWCTYPFRFDLTRKPDSMFFSRPYHLKNVSGLIWTVRAFAAKTEYCHPPPENEVTMNFYKYTIAPVLRPSVQRPISTMDYYRYQCIDDAGTLILVAELDRDVYYQGDEITVLVKISNDSSRHVVCAVSAYVEQMYKFNYEIPHDMSIPIGEVFLGPGQAGIPINPKNKGWTTTIILRPAYDRTKYNLAVDGRMSRDKKIFLAESTVILHSEMVKIEPTELATSPRGKSPEGKKSPGKAASPNDKAAGKKESKDKSGKSKKESKKSPKGSNKSPKPVEPEEAPVPVVLEKEVNTLVENQVCRNVTITYQVVVRASLKTPSGDEGGVPLVRLPFILSRNTRFYDKLMPQNPPVFALEEMH